MSAIWMWSGAVTNTSVVVATKIDGGSARVLVADNVGMTGGTFYNATATTDQSFMASITGLLSNTQYYYQIEDTGVVDGSVVGRFRTFGVPGNPFPHKIWVGGCAGSGTAYPASQGLAPGHVSNHPVFEDIRRTGAHLGFHTGDFAYYNPGTNRVPNPPTANVWRDMYDSVLSTRQGSLYREIPLVYQWDDHDFGPNNSDGSNPYKDIAAQVWREYVPDYAPASSGVSGDMGLYRSFQVGRVFYIVTDERYYRQPVSDPGPRTMLGSSQLTWLENQLAQPPADTELLVWVSEQPPNSAGSTSWGSYTEERDQIYQMFADYGWLTPKLRMLAVAGDQHQFGFDTGTNTNGFPLFTVNSLDSSFGSGGAKAYDLGYLGGRGHFGLITINDVGTRIDVTVDGIIH